jgi:hypothetical protein
MTGAQVSNAAAASSDPMGRGTDGDFVGDKLSQSRGARGEIREKFSP